MPDPSIAKALEEAKKLVADLEAYEPGPANHLALLKQANVVRNALEEPFDVITRLLENLSLAGAVNTLLEIKALTALPADGSAISSEELAAVAKVDKDVIQRTFRVAVVFGIASEPEPNRYAHNGLSRALAPEILGCFFLILMEFSKSWTHLPDYLKEHAPEDIFDLRKSPAVYSQGKEHLGKTYYEVLDMNPEHRDIWNANLAAIDKNMPVLGMFPFKSLKEQVESDPSRPFIVDVGGGKGQSCLAILGDTGGSFGAEVIVQDLPSVIDALKPEELPGIKLMKYDAFTPQPVKNAHVYLMRRFLHDFYNPVCINFVKNTVSAMGPDSRLIICDMLVPDLTVPNENVELYWLDFALMSMTGKEKTVGEFNEIFEAAGLELVKVYESGIGRTVMLETKLKQA